MPCSCRVSRSTAEWNAAEEEEAEVAKSEEQYGQGSPQKSEFGDMDGMDIIFGRQTDG